MQAAKIVGPHATPKGLRHAFGIKAVTSGVPLNMLKKWLGHAQLSTTSIKILITAGVGTFFGVTVAIMMEYVKPWIAWRLSKKAIREQLNDEFLGNLTAIERRTAIFMR